MCVLSPPLSNIDTNIITCAPIVRSEDIRIIQYPDVYVIANQISPYENATVEFSANLPMGEHSILTAAWMTDTPCPIDEEPFDPFNSSAVAFTDKRFGNL